MEKFKTKCDKLFFSRPRLLAILQEDRELDEAFVSNMVTDHNYKSLAGRMKKRIDMK